MKNTLGIFYSGEYEYNINQKMLHYNYTFPFDEVQEYVENVNQITIERLLEHMVSSYDNNSNIMPRDVFQFSNFENATFRLCQVLKIAGDPGVNFLEIGKMLLDDGKQRNDTALIKYGENHAKTAAALSLLHELSHTYFLSCLGYVANSLKTDQRKKLLLRLTLRNKLITHFYIASQNGNIEARELLHRLSNSTYYRRRSNIKKVLKILDESEEYDFAGFTENINL